MPYTAAASLYRVGYGVSKSISQALVISQGAFAFAIMYNAYYGHPMDD